ncbi:hypothetical protein SAMN05892873_106167 [Aeromonas veronii]|nr:hypothetical protein SAMN05892873_106167 [Aeromonas veronii]
MAERFDERAGGAEVRPRRLAYPIGAYATTGQVWLKDLMKELVDRPRCPHRTSISSLSLWERVRVRAASAPSPSSPALLPQGEKGAVTLQLAASQPVSQSASQVIPTIFKKLPSSSYSPIQLPLLESGNEHSDDQPNPNHNSICSLSHWERARVRGRNTQPVNRWEAGYIYRAIRSRGNLWRATSLPSG